MPPAGCDPWGKIILTAAPHSLLPKMGTVIKTHLEIDGTGRMFRVLTILVIFNGSLMKPFFSGCFGEAANSHAVKPLQAFFVFFLGFTNPGLICQSLVIFLSPPSSIAPTLLQRRWMRTQSGTSACPLPAELGG